MIEDNNNNRSPIRPIGRVLDLSPNRKRTSSPSQVPERPKIRPTRSYKFRFLIFLVIIFSTVFYHFYLRSKLQEMRYKRGLTELSQGKFDEAAKNFEKAASGKNETDALYQLAVSKYNQKDFEGAIASYQSVITKDPKNAPAYNGLGNIYRDQKNYSEAEKNYKEAISINPSYIAAYSNWAIMLMDIGKIEEAKKVVSEGLEKNPTSMELGNIRKVLEE